MWLKKSISSHLAPLLPHQCLLCGRPSQAFAICEECHEDLPLAQGPRCPRCAASLPHAAPACAQCMQHPLPLEEVHAAFVYAFPIDRLLHALKFGAAPMFQRLAIAEYFAVCMAASVPLRPIDCIVPVPLSPARLRERGYNQALELAKPLARLLKVPLAETALLRVHETPPQTSLRRKERLRNLDDAFRCPHVLNGLQLLLVDDVLTTGATLAAAAAALKAAGAAAVVGCVAARTP